ncbi:hypothetical protein [Streptomyces venezuelae]
MEGRRHRSVSGHAGRCAMWEIVNAIMYQARLGTDQVIHELLC